MNWQEELSKQGFKYHKVGAWVAIILNPIWAAGDYLEMPDHWVQFFYIRIFVSAISLITLLSHKKLKLTSEWLIFVPFMGIALQNAYMYSVMDTVVLQKHTFAYIALFIGAGMLVLWKPIYTISIVFINLIANIIFFYFFSPLTVGEVLINGGMLTGTVSIFTILLIHTRYNLTVKEIKARLELEESKKEVEHAHNEVQASINYAERIQSALLAGDESWERIGAERFILFRPRDIVSGDFYWAYADETYAIWAAADCTGHGVPGAFMSMLGIGFLNEIVAEGGETNSGAILDKLRTKILHAMDQKEEEQRKDGMDIALCVLNRKSNILQFSGAYNPLLIMRKGENEALLKMASKTLEEGDLMLYEISSDKMPIGKHVYDQKQFSVSEILLEQNDIIYTFTDGFQDQFGGEKGKKYMIKSMKKFLLSNHADTLVTQNSKLDSEFESWMNVGNTKQIDDVCIVGVKI